MPRWPRSRKVRENEHPTEYWASAPKPFVRAVGGPHSKGNSQIIHVPKECDLNVILLRALPLAPVLLAPQTKPYMRAEFHGSAVPRVALHGRVIARIRQPWRESRPAIES